jgi:hypothetical protein
VSTSPLIGPTDADMMLLRLDDHMRVLEQTATLPPGIVAFVPNGQPSTLVWNGMSFAAGFGNYASGTFNPCGYAKDAAGIVYLRGLTAFSPIGSYAGGSMGVTLPAGFRPPKSCIFIVQGSSTNDFMFRCDINADGTITRSIISGGNWDGNYFSYEGIFFDSGSPLLTTSAGATIPDGWLFANGATINAARYGQLVARLKTNVLPDLRAATPLGMVPIIKF